MRINIAIDGPSGAGKSTIADRLAGILGYIHLDTGAMYRCTALKAIQENISLSDEDAVCRMLADTDIRMTPEGGIFLDGRDVTEEIRGNSISMAASDVSKLKRVREDLVRRQQFMAESKGFIMDGRDIGTVVLKDAEAKIFLTAISSARAERRWLQNMKKGITDKSKEEIQIEIEQRDKQDTNRKNSPLKKADDAIEIDSSYMSIDEVVNAIMNIVKPLISSGDGK